MATGTLENLAHSAFVRTPPTIGDAIVRHLLTFPDGPVAVLDPTAGEGDLLAPYVTLPGATLAGVELSADRADVARRAVPAAQIITSAYEHVRVTGQFSLVVTNPPYFFQDGQRAEYRIIRDAGSLLLPGGVMVAILPARSAWDGTMVKHWIKHYDRVRVWKFPDHPEHDEAAFHRFTQIIVIGVRRAVPATSVDDMAMTRLRGFRYCTTLDNPENSPWTGGLAPDDLPTAPLPLADRYAVPIQAEMPSFVVVKADDSTLLRGLETSGAQLQTAWQVATTYHANADVQESIMPSTGVAHQAADVLTGLLDGDILADRYVLATFVTSEWVTIAIDEERKKQDPHLVGVRQQQDYPVLGVLDLETATVQYYAGEDAFGFLTPMLPTLADQVLAKRRPLYQLDPADWEIEVVTQIGLDKQLPGAAYPGLAEPQMHRVFALHRALQSKRQVAIQGEPGTGKTRMLTALIALMAHTWRERAGQFHGPTQPPWARRLRRAWSANPQTAGATPQALPVLVVTPMRVIPTWQQEITAAYPEAEVFVIGDHRDITAWLDRCAVSEAPVVVGILSQSKTRAFGRAWQPAVIPQRDITFRCPDCGMTITALPRGVTPNASVDDPTDDDRREPVTSHTWFKKQRRTCDCGAPLWTDARIPATQRTYPQTSFAAWSQGMDALTTGTAPEPVGTHPVRVLDATGQRGPQAPDSFSPYDYLYRCYRGCVALTIIDESHNARGANTDIARSVHQACLAAQTFVYASGTHYGGMLADLFYYWFRFDPTFWQRLGFGWGDVERAMAHYGVVEQRTKAYESDARKGTGQTDIRVTTIPAPGISARLLPHLLSTMAFIGIMDVGAYMPEKVEIPVVVDMHDPTIHAPVAAAQEDLYAAHTVLTTAQATIQDAVNDPTTTATEHADLAAAEREAQDAWDAARHTLATHHQWATARNLAAAYHDLESTLHDKAQDGNSAAMLAKGTLPRWWCILPCVEPAFAVWGTERTQWGDVTERFLVCEAAILSADHIYPLEQRLIATIAAERAEGRRCMVFFEQNDVRSTAQRLAWVLQDFTPWTLPNSVNAEDREDAIKAAVSAGHDVVIVPYRRVSEGLNLQLLDSTLWYEMPLNLFHLDQASRRTWRLGATNQKRMYYFAYHGTVAYAKLHKLGTQSGAASLFAGDTPDGELAKHAGADQTTLARMSAGLHHTNGQQIGTTDLAAVFQRRSAELTAALSAGRQWTGITDSLPARLAARRARQNAHATALASGRSTITTVVFGNATDIAIHTTRQRRSATKPTAGQLTLFGD